MLVLVLGRTIEASEPAQDLAFLEWLGQTAGVDDVGLSIEALLDLYERKNVVGKESNDGVNVEQENGQ